MNNYFENASSAIKEMYNQVGAPEFDENGMIKKGVIIRHLILPNFIQNSKNILKWIKQNMPEDVLVRVMAQYFPTYKAMQDEKINRKISKKEYSIIEDYIYMLDLKNGYLQDFIEDENEQQYVPDF